MLDGFAYNQVLFDDAGKPVNYVFLEVNETFERQTGLKRSAIVGKKVTEVFPGIEKDPANWIGKYGKVAVTGKPIKFENYSKNLKKWFLVSAYSPKKGYFVSVIEDITDRKLAEEEIARLASFPELNPNPILEVDLGCNVCYSNPATKSMFPDLETLGSKHPFLSGCKEVLEAFHDGKKRTLSREVNVGDAWFYQCFYIIPTAMHARIYAVDIDELKKAENALRENEQRWAATLASIGDAVIATDVAGRITFMNAVAEALTGWTKEEALNKPTNAVFNIINEHTRLEVEDPVARVLEKGLIVGLANHTILVRKDRTEVAIDDSGAPIKDKEGKTTGVVLVFRDITERKKAEEALRVSEEKANALIKYAPTGIYEIDYRVPKFKSVNDAMVSILGYTREELLAMSPFDLLDAESRVRFRKRIMNLLAGKKIDETAEFKVRTKDGWEIFAVLNVVFTYDNGVPDGAVVVAHDVTERRQMQNKLEEYAKNLEVLVEERTKKLEFSSLYARSLIEASLDPLVTISIEGKITDVNRATELATGCSREQLIGSDFSYYFSRPEKAEVGYKRVFTDGFVRDFPLAIRHKSGKITDVLYNATVYRNEKGDIQGAFAAARDVTERKKTEEQLRAASLYSRSLIEASLDPLVTINAEGKITDVNKSTEEVTGCAREELIGSDFSDYFTEPEKARAGYRKVFTEGYVRDYPLAIRHRLGRVTDVLYNASVYRNPQGEVRGVFAAARDITELKKAEEQAQVIARKLKDAERLAAIGETAGMVGHDIRNPLQTIIGELYLAKNEIADSPKSESMESMKESLTAIEEQLLYINKIVADLQDYAKALVPFIEEIDLRRVTDDVLSTVNIPENIHVSIFVEPTVAKLKTDGAYLKRILTNLSMNAIQAMPNGGTLTISADRKDDKVFLIVEDTGEGMPQEIKERIFKPLFTTKSKGQGFGLAVVKKLTEGLNGTVNVESEVGKGTRFTLEFPFSI